MMIKIIRASDGQINDLAPIFDLYRMFYKQTSDLEAGIKFLRERFNKNEAVAFLAYTEDKVVGFTLLYTTFSSVSLQPAFILNDLYVMKEYRQNGIGKLLLDKAKELCVELGYKGLALETAIDNPAQKLYESLGWKKDTHCFHYFWTAEQSQS